MFAAKYYGGEDALARVLDGFFRRDRCTIVCARRGEDADERALLERDDVRRWVEAGSIEIVTVPDAGDISSTRVRGLVERGEYNRVRQLCPPDVAELVERDKLYR